jgi:DNA recombination protein RmuC
MEPILEFSGASVTLVELLIAALLIIGAVLITVLVTRRGQAAQMERLTREAQARADVEAARLGEHLASMRDEQTRLQGRLAQFAEDSAQRDATFRENLDTRLANVSERVGQSIEQTQEKTGKNLLELRERLSVIDAAQNNIKALAGEVSGLQSVLSNKQARGAFGEKQMQDLIRTFLPPRAYDFQATLSNKSRVDALIYMPEGHGDVAVDSKFPMESWRRMVAAENTQEIETAQRGFRADMRKHIRDISQKYLLAGETYELALLFLPSDAIFTELHTHFDAVVDEGFNQRVVIVSPTTFMATLHTMQAVMNDADIQKNAAVIKTEVAILAKDVSRLDDRVNALQRHFEQAGKDIELIQTSTKKITSRAGKIGKVEFDTIESDTPQLKLVGDSE